MGTASTYRRKPVEVEVLQWTGDNIEDVLAFLVGTPHISTRNYTNPDSVLLTVITRDGVYQKVNKNDYIVRTELNAEAFHEKHFNELYETI